MTDAANLLPVFIAIFVAIGGGLLAVFVSLRKR